MWQLSCDLWRNSINDNLPVWSHLCTLLWHIVLSSKISVVVISASSRVDATVTHNADEAVIDTHIQDRYITSRQLISHTEMLNGNSVLVVQPLYSLDLALSGFHLTVSSLNCLREFDSDTELTATACVKNWCADQPPQFYQCIFTTWKEQWQRCSVCNGS